MPIRMEEDPIEDQGGGSKSPNNQGGGGGLGGLLTFLPFILFFVFKRPKLFIPLLIVGGIWYFFLGGSEMFNGGGDNTAYQDDTSSENSPYVLGASLSEEKFDKALVYEPLASGISGVNELPSKVSLQQYAPTAGHQGEQGSCVAWSSAYAARTILEAQATGKKPDQVRFSPSYLYNQIHLDNCDGAYVIDAMKTMQNNGGLPYDAFQYDDQTCSNVPSSRDISEGKQFRIRGYNRLTVGADEYKPDLQAIKQNLAQGAPVVIGAMIGGSFMNGMIGKNIWIPTSRDYRKDGFGGHAMCVIGYDDNREGGAFQIQNSWGEDWGDRGRFWLRYDDFEKFVEEAYGLSPMGKVGDKKLDPTKLGVEFALFDNQNQKVIPLKAAGDLVFGTQQSLKKGSKFKILVANSVECYVYIFGQETDGSTYTLFPYTEKHSPYCGITGTRLFPKDYSMKLDNVGNKDYMAVVLSKTELDYKKLNETLNNSDGDTYADVLKNALGNQRIRTVNFKPGETISFQADAKQGSAVGFVIEVTKY